MVIDGGTRRSPEEHAFALARLKRLLHHSGGIYFGADLEQQLAIASPSAQRRSQTLITLRFCCAPWALPLFVRACSGTRSSTPASPSRCLEIAGGTTPRHRMCWSPALATPVKRH